MVFDIQLNFYESWFFIMAKKKTFIEWREFAREAALKAKPPYPNVVEDSNKNKWCCVSDTIIILMTGIYKKGHEPSAEKFCEEQHVIIENARKNELYMEELKNAK